MKRLPVTAAILACGLLLAVASAEEAMLIGAPDTRPTVVDPVGALQEGWGAVAVALVPEGIDPAKSAKTRQFRAATEAPMVITETTCDPWVLSVMAYRAPIWPEGVDVLSVCVRQTGAEPKRAKVVLKAPTSAAFSPQSLRLGGRAVVALPPPPPVIKGSGCLTAAEAMPNWAHPEPACDPAFRNIRAGMGGVPITYRFRLGTGSSWKVALGFCESHWGEANRRPMLVQVEGAPQRALDPIAEWGRHIPGALLLDGKDANGDGWLEIQVLPKPGAADRNPILNVIWIFAPDARLDAGEVVRGRMNSAAKCYVDVGGKNDQPLTEPGRIESAPGEAIYPLELAPGKEENLTFLVAHGSNPTPLWAETAWTPDTLGAAAEGVWSDWFKTGAPILLPDAEAASQYRAALAEIMMSRGQADDYYAALPKPGGLDQFSYVASGRIVRALDLSGFTKESERMLRLYWQQPLPKPLASVAQTAEGQWADAKGGSDAQPAALLALAEHALLTGDKAWAERAYPAMRAGAEWIRKARAEGKSPAGRGAAWSARALEACADVAKSLGHGKDEAWMRAEAKSLGGGELDEAAAYADLGRCVDAANRVIRLGRGNP